MMNKFTKILENLVVFVATIVVLFLLATVILPRFNYNLIVVKSGSMEPTIKTGSIAISKKQPKYQKGDIITFATASKEIVTHRVTQVIKNGGNIEYKTKGDANNANDLFLVENNRVIGRTIFAMPYFGYLIVFLRSKIGVIILILLPAGYFIWREILKIRKEIKKMKASKQG
ncbi:MAG TPA: signal peptidase I [Candidatus Moranbacteria bacterium]|nr:signal peptidase I [Candidatus Moranbacteria bacterium]